MTPKAFIRDYERALASHGVGTSVLVSDDGRWKLLVEHLGSRAVR